MPTTALQHVQTLIAEGELLTPFSVDSLCTLDYLAALMEVSSPGRKPARERSSEVFACSVTEEYATLYNRPEKVREACEELEKQKRGDAEIRHAVFVLLDGYGWNLLQAFENVKRSLGSESFIAQHSKRAPARTVFPATTAAALSAYGSLRLPAHHAQWGWRVRLAKDGRVVQPLAGDFELSEALEEEDVFKFRSVFARLAEEQARAVAAISAYGGTPSTQRMCGESTLHLDSGELSLAGAVDALQRCWARADAAEQPSFSYVYAANPDKAEHVHGPFDESGAISRGVLESLEQLDKQMRDLCACASPHPRMLLMMADHGQYTVAEHVTLPPHLRAMVQAVTVEPATPSFHLQPSTSVQQFRAAWAGAGLDKMWVLLERKELLASGLLGPQLSEQARDTLGELTGVALGNFLLKSDAAAEDGLLSKLRSKLRRQGLWQTAMELWGLRSLWRKVLHGSDHKGHHGGGKPCEMLVPVFVWSQ